MSSSSWSLATLDGLGQAELVALARRQRELVEAAIERIDELDPLLGAVVWRIGDVERQLELLETRESTGPLAGVPTLLKDIGAPYTGAPERLGSRFIPPDPSDHDSELVARMRRTGMIIVGKSATSEFANSGETTLPGPTNNPWDLERSTSGSSTAIGGGGRRQVSFRSGTAATAAASIRLPAGWCGLFGLKPSRARATRYGPDNTEGCAGASVAHVLTRSVRDSAAALDALAGPDVGAPFLAPPAPA